MSSSIYPAPIEQAWSHTPTQPVAPLCETAPIGAVTNAKAAPAVANVTDAHESQGVTDTPPPLLTFPAATPIPFVTGQEPAATLLPTPDCPYPGLSAFVQGTPHFLFGRQHTLNLLLQRLDQFNFVPLIGPAGSGKSSLLQAGLLPELAQEGWQILGPIHADTQSFETLLTDLQGWERQVVDRTETTPVPPISPTACPDRRTLIVLDPLGTASSFDPTRRRQAVMFLESLLQLLWVAQGRLAVVVSLHPTTVEDWFTSSALTQVLQNQAVWMPPLEQPAWIEAIVRPAQLQGYQLEPDLLARVLADALAESQPLPLLQITLQQLWQHRDRSEHILLTQHYRQIGGVAGALNTYAEKVYANLSKAEQVWTQHLCQALVYRQPQGGLGRRSRSLVDLMALATNAQDQALVQHVINTLIQAQILTVIQPAQASPRTIARLEHPNPFLTLTQEILCERWQRLVNWLTPSLPPAPMAPSNDEPALAAVAALPFLPHAATQLSQLADYLTTHPLEGAKLVLAAVQAPAPGFPAASPVPVQGLLRQVLEIAREQQCFGTQQDAVQSLAISAKGCWLVFGGADGPVRCWDRQGQECIPPMLGHTDAVAAIALSPDGELIVSGSWDGTLRIWDWAGHAIADPCLGHTDFVTAVAFSPDGQRIVSASVDGSLRLWDRQGQPVGLPMTGYPGLGTAVAVSPDGTLIVAGSAKGTLTFWNWAGQVVQPLVTAHAATITDLAFSPDGKLIVSASSDGTLRLWNRQGQAIGPPLQGHTDSVETVAFSPDGTLILSGSADMTLRLWDCWGNAMGPPLLGHQDQVEAVVFHPSGRQAWSASSDGTIRCWDVWGNRLGPDLRGHTDLIEAIAISPDGTRLVSGGWDRTLRLWDLQGGAAPACWEGHADFVAAVAFNPAGDRIASGSWDGTVGLWTLAGDCVQRYTIVTEAAIACVVFRPDGHWVWAGSADGYLHGWDLRTQGSDLRYQGHSDYVAALAFSPDGRYFVSASTDGTLRIWDPNGRPLPSPAHGHTAAVTAVAISPDGSLIASGGRDGHLRFWSPQGEAIANLCPTRTLSPLMTAPAEAPLPLTSLAFSPNGDQILMGLSDGRVCLWDVVGQALLGSPWPAHADFVTTVVFSPDGQMIATGSADRTIRLWRGGNWQDWLRACHDRLAQHPLYQGLVNPDRPPHG